MFDVSLITYNRQKCVFLQSWRQRVFWCHNLLVKKSICLANVLNISTGQYTFKVIIYCCIIYLYIVYVFWSVFNLYTINYDCAQRPNYLTILQHIFICKSLLHIMVQTPILATLLATKHPNIGIFHINIFTLLKSPQVVYTCPKSSVINDRNKLQDYCAPNARII